MPPSTETYEKLGAFYLGRPIGEDGEEAKDVPLLYDSKDLLTHAMCVGMTGSGKTGLCISLLEEAAIDRVPAIVIDPKGDLANLLLTFPELRPEDFEPWVDSGAAERKGMSREEFAASQAELWRGGLESWGQSGERIAKLHESVEMAVYTPGSEAGRPISILASFGAPPKALVEDADLLRERVSSTVSSLLGLLGIDADPLRSREHILLSNLLDDAWRAGRDLDLAGLIQAIQKPPMTRVGVFDLESFFPADDRFELAMTLNNLLAAPGFASWFQGESLDVDTLLHGTTGKPRIAIFSIAHLAEAERMFFVSLLLNQTLGWMRQRPGSTSLQAILYMDEVFGYMPPVSNPPSKQAMLTLLKQARAFGLGVVLATQNPVDLDYKGLSNTGTWFLGRLQTERDKARVLDGLQGAGGGRFDRATLEKLLSGLGKRVFLLYNVHEGEPVLFRTRWAMSYLRGPMTRLELQRLTADAAPPSEETKAAAASTPAAAPATPPAANRQPPALPPEIDQLFLPSTGGRGELVYRPHLVASARLHYADARRGLDHWRELLLLTPLDAEVSRPDWEGAEELELEADDLERRPESEAIFAELPAAAGRAKSYTSWQRQLKQDLYRTRPLELFKCAPLKETSRPEESERDFRIRLAQRAREERDAKTEKLRKRYVTKIDRLEERLRRAEQKVEREEEQAKQQKMNTFISLGMTAVSALFGRKKLSSTTFNRASSAARGMARSRREGQDVDRAREDVEALQEQLRELEAELQTEIDELEDTYQAAQDELDTLTIKPRKTDIEVSRFALAWAPCRKTSEGFLERAW